MDNRSNILHLRASNFFGGPEKQLVEHFSCIDSTRFKMSLCTFEESVQDSEFLSVAKAHGFDTCHIRTRSAFDTKAVMSLVEILKQNKINLLCTHGYKPNVVGRIAGWIAGIPVVAISRGWTAETFKIRFFEKLDKLFLHFADHVVAVSEGQKKKIVRLGVRPGKVSVIHNGISLENIPVQSSESLRATLGLPESAIVVATAGRLSPEKNHTGMIEAAKYVVQEQGNVYFVIFGEGFLRFELEKKIDEAGLQGRFILPGFCRNLQSVLNQVDIFMLPSFTEGLPNVVLEAFAVKKPVIATVVGGTPEVVKHKESGFLTQPEETALMAQYILRLVDDETLRNEMGKCGYRHVQEYFGFERQTELYEDLYFRLSGQSASSQQKGK